MGVINNGWMNSVLTIQMKTSEKYSLDLQDAVKGLIMAVGAAVFALIAESLQKGQFTFDFTAIWHTAVAAAIVYLSKNFFTPTKVIKDAAK